MPTGNTYKIEKKENYSFKEYVLQCARSFGALYHMRDSDSTEIELRKESNYYKDKIVKIEKELKNIKKITIKEANKLANEKYKKEIKTMNESLKKEVEINKRYDIMLKKVEGWEPPTKDHVQLKNLMIQQIDISYNKNLDCYDKNILKFSGKQWLYKKKKELIKDLNYYIKKWEKETRRVQNCNNWIKELQKSLNEYGEK